MSQPSLTHILYLGPKWRGSDARALAEALRRQGCALTEVDYEDFVPPHWSGFVPKVARRLLGRWFARDYNRAVAMQADNRSLDAILVFKGMHLRVETLERFTVPRYCVYPDVSFTDHGPDIWNCLPLYDCLFTTKAFHLGDPVVASRVKYIERVSHGADPEVHRPLSVSSASADYYGCDVAFVGCWSPKKESLVKGLLDGMPSLRVRLWGPGWERAASPVRHCWGERGVFGDELALVYQTAKINLGLLSEAGGGPAAEADQTTARTWQIPACGAFMLHERTEELVEHFVPEREIGCFEGGNELCRQVDYWLAHEDERRQVAAAGRKRFLKAHYTYDRAAEAILEHLSAHQANMGCRT